MSLIVSPRPSWRSLGGEVEAVAAELGDSDLERDARSRRRLLEDHPERAPGEELVRLAPLTQRLELVGEVERGLQLLGVPRADAREVPPLEMLRYLDHEVRMLRGLVTRFRQQHPQALEAGEHAALDGAERLPEPLGELGLGEPSVVGELDRLALLGGQAAQRVRTISRARARDDALVGAGARRLGSTTRPARCADAPRGGRGRRPAGGRT